MGITRNQKSNLDDFVGVTTSMLTIAGAFPALGDFGIAANALSAGFELLYIALQRVGAFQIDKIKSLQLEYEEVIKKSFDCAKGEFTSHSTKQLFDEVNLKISNQIEQKVLDKDSSLDDIYNAVLKAVMGYYKIEQETPSGNGIKSFFEQFWHCFDVELSAKPELSSYIQIKELRKIKDQIQKHEEWLIRHDEEIEETNRIIKESTFIQHEIVFKRPGLPVKEYVEPEGIVFKIDSKLMQGRPLLICSPGGIGKSELCRKYYAEKKEDGEFVWFNFIDSIETTLLSVADQSKLADPIIRSMELNRVLEKLKILGKSATIIIDNVIFMRSEDVDLLSNMGCKIIISSRERREALECNLERLELDYLPIPLCREVFKRYSKKTGLENEMVELDEVISLAGRHTLAIQLLAKIFAQSPKYNNLRTLLNELNDNGFMLPELVTQNRDDEYREFIAHFRKLFDLAGVSDDADKMRVLKNMAIIGSTPTPREQLFRWIGEEYQKAYKELVNSSWISEQNYMTSMHDMISEAIKAQATPVYSEYKKIIEVMAEELEFEDTDAAKYRPQYFQQNRAVSENILLFGVRNKEIARLYHNIAGVYFDKGEYESSLEYYKQALEIRETELGKQNVDTATTYNDIGLVYKIKGEYDEAIKYYKKALSIREEVLGRLHSDTATVYNNIAGVNGAKGENDKALKYYMQALEICEAVLGKQDPLTATTYNNIAIVYKAKRDYRKALNYYHQALEISEAVLGKQHPNTATMYNNIGIVYKIKGEYDEAIKYYKQALVIREAVLGKQHPFTASTYNNIAGVKGAKGENEEALKYYMLALEINKTVLGKQHPRTATVTHNIAGVFKAIGKYEISLEYYKKSYNVLLEVLSKDHSNTRTVYKNMKLCFIESGRDQDKFESWLDENIK